MITLEMVGELIKWTSELGGKAFKINTKNLCLCLQPKIKELELQLKIINANKTQRLDRSNSSIENMQLDDYYFLTSLKLH